MTVPEDISRMSISVPEPVAQRGPKDEEARKRTGDLYEELEKSGHCKVCAAEIVKNAAEFLSE